MRALFTFTPKFCPNCGRPIVFVDQYARADYLNGCTHSCPRCGLEYVYVEPEHVRSAAVAANTDADRYW